MMSNDVRDVAAELLALEEKRRQALSTKDWATLEAFCADDLTHTHSSGRTEDLQTWLAGLKKRPRAIERRDLIVRVYGDTAIMTGIQINSPEGAEPDPDPQLLKVIQVWIKNPGGWQVAASQTTRVK